ncbi:MAG TPA: monovalent cation/H+ antiporter complex subunit F [Solirubrobacteraceae bacterium]|nr:monovalent cation/H+ antiporter complex subunit F [Solirubrobacteraceae bacterium]
MSVWMLSAVVLVVAWLPCLGVCLLATEWDALVAVELGSTLLTTVLMLLSIAYQRQPFIDLSLAFLLVSVVGSVAFARTMEAEL